MTLAAGSAELARVAEAPGVAARPVETGRDAGVDALRALAIVGVVLGHWLVTALVLLPDGTLDSASPLASLGALAPVTWLLQTLALFFFAAGFGAARAQATRARITRSETTAQSETTARPGAVRPWSGGVRRLVRPALGFAALWTVALLAAVVAGAPLTSLRTVAVLAASPLWFLAVLVALTALTAPVRAIAAVPHGAALLAGAAVAVVACADAGHGWMPLTVLAAWLVPYTMGVGVGSGRLASRRAAAALAVGGVVALLVLIGAAGYPESAVGVPGSGRSNLNPPSLAAVALAVAQVGVALLLRPALGRWVGCGRVRAAVAAVNAGAMRIYLWHQTVLITVTLLALRLSHGAPVPGLHTTPDAAWLVARLGWLPVLGAGLAVAVVARARTTRSTRGCTMTGVCEPGRPTEVIAVRSSDPPSRGRAVRQPS